LTEQSQDSALRGFLIGGNMQVIGNAEIEFPIFDKVGIRGVVFTDVGNSFNLEKDQYCKLRPTGVDPSKDPCRGPLDLSAYRASWGFGFRWFSPIGPLRFEWGVPFPDAAGRANRSCSSSPFGISFRRRIPSHFEESATDARERSPMSMVAL